METNTNHPNDTFKLVALINKRLESGVAMNALAHATAAAVNLAGQKGRESLKFLNFVDAEGQLYPGISARSFIILRGTDADIRKLCASAMAAGLPFAAFTNTMTGGTYFEQLERTKVTHTQDLVFYALVALGNAEVLNPLTKKFSLWRNDSPQPQATSQTETHAAQRS